MLWQVEASFLMNDIKNALINTREFSAGQFISWEHSGGKFTTGEFDKREFSVGEFS